MYVSTDMNFVDPIDSRIRTISYCETNKTLMDFYEILTEVNFHKCEIASKEKR